MTNPNQNPINLNSDSYKAFKQTAANAVFIRKELPFSEIDILSDEIIRVSGVMVNITPKAFSAMVRALGLGKQVMENVGNIAGEKMKKDLIEIMRRSILKNEDKNKITLIMNAQTKAIVDVLKKPTSTLTNGAMIDLFEQVMQNNRNMVIKNMSVNRDGHLEISVINPDWEFDIAGLNDEHFHTGLTFINTPSATIICPFNERLVCTNGMVTRQNGTSLMLTNSDATSINGFFAKVREIKDMSYFQNEFKNRAKKLMSVTASFGELKKSVDNVQSELDMNDMWNRAKIEEFFDYDFVLQSYLDKKFDLITVHNTPEIWKNAKTNKTVWELVNAITDIASHSDRDRLNFREKNASVFRLQKYAGDLFFKNPLDLEMQMTLPQVF